MPPLLGSAMLCALATGLMLLPVAVPVRAEAARPTSEAADQAPLAEPEEEPVTLSGDVITAEGQSSEGHPLPPAIASA